jgi:hypothetical protein
MSHVASDVTAFCRLCTLQRATVSWQVAEHSAGRTVPGFPSVARSAGLLIRAAFWVLNCRFVVDNNGNVQGFTDIDFATDAKNKDAQEKDLSEVSKDFEQLLKDGSKVEKVASTKVGPWARWQ